METQFLLALIFCFLFQACATSKSLHNKYSQGPFSLKSTLNGLVEDSDKKGENAELVPKNQSKQPVRPLVLVLGEGGFNGLVYAGVIQGLVDLKIPIAAIVGEGFGAFIGCLYAMNGNINEFEWDLQKIKRDALRKKAAFFSIHSELSKVFYWDELALENLLEDFFGNKDLLDSKIPIYIGFSRSVGEDFSFYQQGSAKQIVFSSLVSPKKTNTMDFLVQKAKELQLGPLVEVAFFEKKKRGQLQMRQWESDLVLKLEKMGEGVESYQKKTESIYRGKKAVFENLFFLKKLTGQVQSEAPEKRDFHL